MVWMCYEGGTMMVADLPSSLGARPPIGQRISS